MDTGILSNFQSSKNILLAHSQVVRWYREKIKGRAKWSLKFSFMPGFPMPLDPSNLALQRARFASRLC
ncbi:hypothetical protein BJX63DRAFT_403716 [Aspergillus granulosus]|uniref:Uncharacterized protein n=1 Tax=Aspergillus granulosus TaxID=176169 RepID=A0ABR4H349_9EURO